MTSQIRRAAGWLTVIESFWVAYAQVQVVEVSCPAVGCTWPSPYLLHSPVVLLLAVLLFGVGLLELWGASVAFLAGALLSVAALFVMGYSAWTDGAYGYLQGEAQLAWIGAGFAVAALAANVFGARRRSALSEQANPMNLPVFG